MTKTKLIINVQDPWMQIVLPNIFHLRFTAGAQDPCGGAYCGVGVTVSNCIVNSELCSLNGADYIIHAPKAALSAARTTGVILHEPIHCLTH